MEKFDVTKLFDAEAALSQVEKYTQSAIGYIPHKDLRGLTETVANAHFDFARAQAIAGKSFAETMRKAFQI